MGDEKHSLLRQKGDGIKARYIPELLRFINEHENRSKYYVWGFEEPENSLDLGAAQNEAQRFASFAKRSDTQVFITSHSPAFYLAESKHDKHTRRYFVTKQKFIDEKISPENAVAEIDDLPKAEKAMKDAGLLELPYVIGQMQKERERRKLAEAEAKKYRGEITALENKLAQQKKPFLLVEGKHDVTLFEAAFTRLGLDKELKVLPLGGTPKNARTLLQSITDNGVTLQYGVFFLFDNDNDGRKAFKNVSGEADCSRIATVGQNVYAWCLPLSDDYREFLKRWKIQENNAKFVAEFLYPAKESAKLYETLISKLDGNASVSTAIHADINGQVGLEVGVKEAERQELSNNLYNSQKGSVDWFFSRCVDDNLKEAFATKIIEERLTTEQLDAIAKMVGDTLRVSEKE